MVTLREYETRVVEGVRLSSADRALCAGEQLAGRLQVRELAGGRMELTAGPCVGVVRLDACEIRVLPKYLGEELDVLRMLEYAAGRGLPTLDAARTVREGAPHLRDLVALLATEHCERLLARGVRRDYVTVEDELPAVRGGCWPTVRSCGTTDGWTGWPAASTSTTRTSLTTGCAPPPSISRRERRAPPPCAPGPGGPPRSSPRWPRRRSEICGRPWRGSTTTGTTATTRARTGGRRCCCPAAASRTCSPGGRSPPGRSSST